MRRFGDPKRADIKYMDRPGAYGVILAGNRLLLTAQDSFEVELQLPGGGIDPGESPVQALHREVFEETGHRVRVLKRLGAYQRFCFIPEYDMWAHKICHIYLCSAGRRVGPPTEEGHSVVHMNANDAVAELSNDGDRFFVQRFLTRD